MNIKATILGATMGALGLTGRRELRSPARPPRPANALVSISPPRFRKASTSSTLGSIGNYRDFSGTSNLRL